MTETAAAAPRAGVLLDVDGTLLDTNYLHTLAWWQALRDTGHEVSMAAIHRRIGIASEGLVEDLLGHVDEDTVEAHSSRYEALHDQIVAFPKTTDLVEAVAGLGVKVILATSGKEKDLEWMRPAIGAEDSFSGATTSSDVEAGKPAPDLLAGAIEQHGLDPARTVAVGDTVWDVKAAERSGISCIALTCGGISAAELRAAGAAEVYDDPADLLANLADSLIGKLGT